jgi:hypothetical protein
LDDRQNVVHSNPYEDFAHEFNDYTKNVYENPEYHYENGVMVPNYGYESSYEFCWKFDPNYQSSKPQTSIELKEKLTSL